MRTGRHGEISLARKYFLDTYALMEYVGGNKSYLRYFSPENSQLLKTSILNLMELYYHVLRDAGENAAEDTYAQFKQFSLPLTDDDVKNAMKLRLRLKSRRLDISYTDAVGYSIAERLGARFLTGDRAFKSLSNVEFVR
jgi:predicted nucleic acid-binding protein